MVHSQKESRHYRNLSFLFERNLKLFSPSVEQIQQCNVNIEQAFIKALTALFKRSKKFTYTFRMHTEKSILILVDSKQVWIVIIVFLLIWHQTGFRLVLNLSEMDNSNPNWLVCINQNQKKIISEHDRDSFTYFSFNSFSSNVFSSKDFRPILT